MSFAFRPARSFSDRHGLFISLTGGTNSGKSFSALRLARGIAGPSGKIAAVDTEGGRLLHLKDHFDFDVDLMGPPFRPQRFAEAAKQAEDSGYDALLIDSFSMQWTGLGGVLDWHEEELQAAVERAKQRPNDRRSEYAVREASKFAAWIKPKSAHKSMVYSLLQRRIPIIFAIRGEESVKPGGPGEQPIKTFKSICSATFPFEVTVSFRLDSERKGYVDLRDPKSWKMEETHQAIFHDGDRISEEHGAALAGWARGETAATHQTQTDAPLDNQRKATVGDWIDKTLPGLLAACETLEAIEAVQMGKVYQAALAKASETEKADMQTLIAAAVERLSTSESTDEMMDKSTNGADTAAPLIARVQTMDMAALNKLDSSAEFRAECKGLDKPAYDWLRAAIDDRVAMLRAGA